MRLALFAVFLYISATNSLYISQDDREYARYLVDYGYLSWSSLSSSRGHWYADDNGFANALRSFQNYVKIDASGVLDSTTKSRMSLARCEIKDVGHRSKRYTTIGRWPKKFLTYKIMQYSSKISRQEVDSLIFLAFSVWADPSGITITNKQQGRVDIEIWFGQLAPRQSNRIAFGNTKKKSRTSVITLNDDIIWSQDFRTEQPNLFQTATHEIGHVLGLGHTEVLGAVMYPIYDLGTKIFSLDEDDKRGIQDIYKDLKVVSYPGRHVYRENANKLRNSFGDFKNHFSKTFQNSFGMTPEIEDFNIPKDFFPGGF